MLERCSAHWPGWCQTVLLERVMCSSHSLPIRTTRSGFLSESEKHTKVSLPLLRKLSLRIQRSLFYSILSFLQNYDFPLQFTGGGWKQQMTLPLLFSDSTKWLSLSPAHPGGPQPWRPSRVHLIGR